MKKFSQEHQEMLETGTKNLLQAIGDNPNRDGLLETPKR
jgi:GTP cyclohydrolase I